MKCNAMAQTSQEKEQHDWSGMPSSQKEPNPRFCTRSRSRSLAQINNGWGKSTNNDGKRMSDGSSTSPVQSNPHSSNPSASTFPGHGRGRITRNARMSVKWPPSHLFPSIDLSSIVAGQCREGNTPRGKTDESIEGRQMDHPNCVKRDRSCSPKIGGSNNEQNQDKPRGREENYNNTTDGWGNTDHHTIPDATNQSRSDLSPDGGFDRRSERPMDHPNWSQDEESHSHSQRADLSKTERDGWGRQSPSMTQSMSRPLSPWSQAAQNLQNSGNKKESEQWGPSHLDLPRSSSLSPWSQAAQDVQPIHDSTKTDGWGDALDHTSINAWSTNKTLHRTNRSSTSLSEPKRRITGRYHRHSREVRRSNNEQPLERSRGREQNNNNNTTDWWSNTDHQNIPDSWNQSGSNLSPDGGFNRTERDGWGRQSPSMTQFTSRPLSPWSQAAQDLKNSVNEKESEKWGPSHVDLSRSRSMSPWSRAAHDIRPNQDNTKNDGWGNALDHSSVDAWSRNKSIRMTNYGSTRREHHVSKSSDRNTSKGNNKWGRKQNNNNNTTDRWGSTDHHTISDARNQFRPNLPPDGGFDRSRTSGSNQGGPGVRNSSTYHPKDAQTGAKWTVPGVASSSLLILDVNQKKGRDGIVMDKASSNPQISSQNHRDVKGKAIMNSDADTLKSHAINTFSMDPSPAVHTAGPSQPNPNVIITKGDTSGTKTDEVNNSSFKWALIGFAKAKLRPFLVKQHFTDEMFMLILRKFVENVARSLGPRAPQTDVNCRVFIKEQDQSLSNFLDQTYLQRYANEEFIKNTRDEQRNAT